MSRAYRSHNRTAKRNKKPIRNIHVNFDDVTDNNIMVKSACKVTTVSPTASKSIINGRNNIKINTSIRRKRQENKIALFKVKDIYIIFLLMNDKDDFLSKDSFSFTDL